MLNKSHKLAKLTSNLKVSNPQNFEQYLKEVFADLIKRRTRNINDPINSRIVLNLQGITKLIFSKYYSLPGIIGDRLFRVFDSRNKGIIEYNDFKRGMLLLFCGDYEKTLRFIFDFYDFDGNGKISQEDIRIVLLYIIFSNRNLKNNLNENISGNNNNNIFDNQLDEMLNICFNKKNEEINFNSFINIIENINSDIYFMTYIFLLKKKPFSFNSIELYGNNNAREIYAYSNLKTNYYPETTKNMKTGKILININKFPNNMPFNKIVKNEANYGIKFNRKSIEDDKIFYDTYLKRPKNSSYNKFELPNNCFIKRYKSYISKNKINNNLFDKDISKTIYEAKLPNDLVEEMNKMKLYDEENKLIENKELNDTPEIEKINFSGYIYKIKNGEMKKLYFQLFFKDLFYYKNDSDTKHYCMHNLSGLFFKEEATKILYDAKYYSFSLIFPDKKHTYFCTDKSEFKLWKKYLRLATNYSNILEMYEISKVIGEGSFSKVKLAINKVTKEKVAVKIIEKKKLSSVIIESTLTEIEIMKICQFPYIIKFIDAYENFEFIYIFMEYCPGGTLFEFLEKRNYTLSEKLCCNIIYKICLAVNYFHSYGINHRDLKPDNILMTSEDDDSEIRILDFGLGKIIGPSEKCSEPFGTIIFCAPEIILCKPYNKTVDSWSIGVITYALLFAKLPFYDKERAKLKQLIVHGQPIYKGFNLPNVSDYAINFMQKFLNKDLNKRMTVAQALEHKWFQVYNKENVMKINQYIKDKEKEKENRNNIIQYFYQSLNKNNG